MQWCEEMWWNLWLRIYFHKRYITICLPLGGTHSRTAVSPSATTVSGLGTTRNSSFSTKMKKKKKRNEIHHEAIIQIKHLGLIRFTIVIFIYKYLLCSILRFSYHWKKYLKLTKNNSNKYFWNFLVYKCFQAKPCCNF